jgi:hypothetical protein
LGAAWRDLPRQVSVMVAIIARFRLLVLATRVINVIVTVSHRKEITYMKTFTIDTDNNITVHASRKAVAAAWPMFAYELNVE